MQFTYHQEASSQLLTIEAELQKYLFKVRRHSIDQPLFFRNLQDKNLYKYQVENIGKKNTTLRLLSFEPKPIEPKKKLHIGWCVIDPKLVEKYIASLNELGVEKITFIYCNYSQKSYKLNFEKLEKIVINSSQQCGRSSVVTFESVADLQEFHTKYPQSYMFNFSDNLISEHTNDIQTLVIGCEGGFSKEEVASFDSSKIVGIKSDLILRSETAVLSASTVVLHS